MRPIGPTSCYIQLREMPQLTEAVDGDDNWTGLTDATLRRRRQNRLNVRAYRRRKAQQVRTGAEPTSAPLSGSQARVPCWNETQQAVIHLPTGAVTNIIGDRRTPLVPAYPETLKCRGIIFPLSLDHLITLLQFNVLRGCLANHELLARLEPSTTPHEECSSAALHVSADFSVSNLQSLPHSLHPTELQRTVPHEGWIDSIPDPTFRDNCIRAAGTFDEDQLWSDTIGGLFEGFPDSEVEHRGVVMWSPPWSISGWELSEGFWRRWGWLLKGRRDILDATNKRREGRGEQPLVFEVRKGHNIHDSLSIT